MSGTVLKVVVADDEPAIRQDIADAISGSAGFELVASCRDGAEAVEAILEHDPDAVFLDVRMPELDGFEVIESLGGQRTPHVVFVTAYDQYAIKAFEVEAVDYLLKPFDLQRLNQALSRLRTRLERGARGDATSFVAGLKDRKPLERIVAKDRGKVRLIPLDTVSHITAADNYLKVHCQQKTYLVRHTIAGLSRRLDPSQFARIHRSTIVRLAQVEELVSTPSGDFQVVLHGGIRLTLSRGFRREFEDRIGWKI